jgi:hypothetical protein
VRMTAINLRRKCLPRIQLYPKSKLVISNVSISRRLFFPDPHDTSRSMHPMGDDDYPGMIPWKMPCMGVNSAKLRPILMKVFLIIKFSKAPLSIKVLATLCRPIRILMMKGRFLSDNSMSRWSSGLNEMSASDHLILLPGSIHWARLISRWSFFPCVLEAMDILPPKITLINPICSSPSESTQR